MVSKKRADTAHSKRIEQFIEYEKQGLNYNFGHYDWELLFVYDYELRRRVIAFPHISHSAKHLYVMLKSYLIETKDFCFPDQKSLAALMGCSISSITKYLKELQKYDLIQILKFKYGNQNKNVYVINRVDKINTIKRILIFKDNQPDDLKPVVQMPEFEVDEIVNFLKEKTGNIFNYVGISNIVKTKTPSRDKKGRFTSSKNKHNAVDKFVDKSKNIVNNQYLIALSHGNYTPSALVKNTSKSLYNLPHNNINKNIDINYNEFSALRSAIEI